MPLAERDINTQRDIPRTKRSSFQNGLAYTQLNDENSPSPRSVNKITPPAQRILAPTKSSAAKTNTPVTGKRTPQSQLQAQSKLPLCGLTPISSSALASTPSPSRSPVRASKGAAPAVKKDTKILEDSTTHSEVAQYQKVCTIPLPPLSSGC